MLMIIYADTEEQVITPFAGMTPEAIEASLIAQATGRVVEIREAGDKGMGELPEIAEARKVGCREYLRGK